MSPVGALNTLIPSAGARTDIQLTNFGSKLAPLSKPEKAESFDKMLSGLIATVDVKQSAAQAETRKVLLGQTDQLHQSVIATQEAGVAFSMMIEVRNKLVESYQELMRMQV